MPKKRFSAFDDFPVETGQTPDWQPEPDDKSVTAVTHTPGRLAEPVGEEHNSPYVTGSGDSHILHRPQAPQVERIERLRPSQMLPDRFQPRRLLPSVLRGPFFSGQMSCYEAAGRWLQLARADAGLQAE